MVNSTLRQAKPGVIAGRDAIPEPMEVSPDITVADRPSASSQAYKGPGRVVRGLARGGRMFAAALAFGAVILTAEGVFAPPAVAASEPGEEQTAGEESLNSIISNASDELRKAKGGNAVAMPDVGVTVKTSSDGMNLHFPVGGVFEAPAGTIMQLPDKVKGLTLPGGSVVKMSKESKVALPGGTDVLKTSGFSYRTNAAGEIAIGRGDIVVLPDAQEVQNLDALGSSAVLLQVASSVTVPSGSLVHVPGNTGIGIPGGVEVLTAKPKAVPLADASVQMESPKSAEPRRGSWDGHLSSRDDELQRKEEERARDERERRVNKGYEYDEIEDSGDRAAAARARTEEQHAKNVEEHVSREGILGLGADVIGALGQAIVIKDQVEILTGKDDHRHSHGSVHYAYPSGSPYYYRR